MTSVQNFKSMLRGGSILPFLLICTAGLLVYSNTLHGPFLLDEEKYLRDNPFVKSVEGSLGPMEPGCELYKSIVQRYIGYLTFALNYRVHGLRVEGYHVVNATVHILNGVLVYLVALLTFRTPRLTRSALSGHARTVALFSGLLFFVHPVQTEAVIYIMQRLASLVAFFSLLSLVLYIMWRLPRIAGEGSGGQGQSGLKDHGSLWWYAGSILSAVLAMKTKENAFTLLAAIMAFELFFFSGDVRKRIVRLLPLMATMLIIPASTLFLMIGKGMPLAQMAAGGGSSSQVMMSWRTWPPARRTEGFSPSCSWRDRCCAGNGRCAFRSPAASRSPRKTRAGPPRTLAGVWVSSSRTWFSTGINSNGLDGDMRRNDSVDIDYCAGGRFPREPTGRARST